MRTLLIFILAVATYTAGAQTVDAAKLKKELPGIWEVQYSLHVDEMGTIIDTNYLYVELPGSTFVLVFREGDVMERERTSGGIIDTTDEYDNSGPWTINGDDPRDIVLVNECAGSYACGVQEVEKFDGNTLVLKQCLDLENRTCNVVTLKKIPEGKK
jgi:hypothetical protein